tara:strand:- start:10504 stop:12429 length:1926 start_codon:yes stop_codon:yes gene_type:complete
MARYGTQFKLDSQMQSDGDMRFVGLASGKDPATLPQGFLAEAKNIRLDRGVIRGRKGLKRIGTGSDHTDLMGRTNYGAGAYTDPADGIEKIVVASDDRAFFIIPDTNGVTKINFQEGETIAAAVEPFQAQDQCWIFRGGGPRLPFALDTGATDVRLGEYPLVYDSFNTRFLRPETYEITNSTGSGVPVVLTTAREHSFKTGDLVTVNNVAGNTNANGTYVVTKVSATTFSLDGRTGNGTWSSPSGKAWASSESNQMPPGDFAARAANRLAVATGRHEVRFSNILDPNTFDPLKVIQVDAGGPDAIQALEPIHDDGLLVMKRTSMFYMSGINALDNVEVTELTRQMGVAARRSVVTMGGQLFFLSDSGVYAVDMGIKTGAKVGAAAALLKVSEKPISEDIQNWIDEIPIGYEHKACAVFNNNRYYIALPNIFETDSGNYRPKYVAVFNTALRAWESVDFLPWHVDELVVGIYNKQRRVFALTSNGGIFVHEENANGKDEYGTGGTVSTAYSEHLAATRGYTLGELTPKKWTRITARFKSLGTYVDGNQNYSAVYAYATDPDEYGGWSYWGLASPAGDVELVAEEFTESLVAKARGSFIQIYMTNGKLPTAVLASGGETRGRIEFQGVTVEGYTSLRQSRIHY